MVARVFNNTKEAAGLSLPRGRAQVHRHSRPLCEMQQLNAGTNMGRKLCTCVDMWCIDSGGDILPSPLSVVPTLSAAPAAAYLPGGSTQQVWLVKLEEILDLIPRAQSID